MKRSPLRRPRGYVVFDGEFYVEHCSGGRACAITSSLAFARLFRRRWQAEAIALYWSKGQVITITQETWIEAQRRWVDKLKPDEPPVVKQIPLL